MTHASHTQVKGYRRRHGEMYRRVAAADGRHDTHAWERVSDMRDFVYDATRKEVRTCTWLHGIQYMSS